MIRNLFTPSVSLLFKRLAIVLVLFSLTRIIFWVANFSYFQNTSLLILVLGLRFDFSIIAYTFSLFILLSLLPFKFTNHSAYRFIQAVFFFLPLGLCLLMNLSDTVYFKFISRRSTIDILRYFSTPDSDGWRLMSQFILDFWYIPLIFMAMMAFAFWIYNGLNKHRSLHNESIKKQSIWLFVISGLLILAGRGGLQLTPISLVDAGLGTTPKNIPLVLNTPFSVLVTAFQQNGKPLYFFDSREESEKYFSVKYKVVPTETSFKGRNVVVLILESFGKEYIGYYNKDKGYTPFLDSLLQQSYVFPNSYANGKQSIDAVPAILSGIPALMQDPFTYSVYAGNRTVSLATYFKKEGYTTQFFHGGSNGTMGFEAFCKYAGVDDYFGKDEYPEVERDYDGNWGIFDEPYLKYCANMFTKNKKPFFSLIFTLSSHHPYTIPVQYKGKFPKGTYDIHESIGYADFSLRQFFEEAKKQPWYNNTLFVITADHTGQSDVPFYHLGMGAFAVPIVFYDPQQKLKGLDSTSIQHIDLFPTLLSLMGENVRGNFWGRNAFDKKTDHNILNFNYGYYYYLNQKDSLQFIFDGGSSAFIYRYPTDSLFKNNVFSEFKPWVKENTPFIQARIQSYYQNMEENSMYFDLK